MSASEQYAKWGITQQTADTCGLFDVDNAAEIYPDFDPQRAIIIPYYNLDRSLMTFDRDGETKPFCRVRYLDTGSKSVGSFAGPAKAQRYSQPGKSGTRAYFCPTLDWAYIARDIQEPLIITEGEAKAIAGVTAGFPVLALGGVFNFATQGESLLPELEAIIWRGRDVYICFDSDALTNPNILAAEARLVDELQRKRGARCFLIRLPADDADGKVGLDDFLLKFGAPAFVGLLENAVYLGALDAKVVSLNSHVAWIEQEGMVYDIKRRMFLDKSDFVKGSRFSAIKHIVAGGKQRKEAKEVSVADAWLTHSHAQRYSKILFRPGEGPVTQDEYGDAAMNMWMGWPESEPNEKLVAPFMALTDHVFSKMPEKIRDVPLKLLAYKLQNPHVKIPLALVLLGPQGSGKSLWAECLAEVFKPYGTAIPAAEFGAKFQGFMERNLLCVVNEAESNYVKQHGERLKSLISDIDQYMDEKYRPARSIKSYTFYVLSANDPAVGSFAHDDRRMIVVGVPKAKDGGHWPVYEELGITGTWRYSGGPAAVRHYLLNLDLKGWKPPPRAPMTAEKRMAFREGLTAVQSLANDMKTSTESTVKLWMDQAAAWSEMTIAAGPSMNQAAASATLEGLKRMQIRTFYEASELALLFPMLLLSQTGAKYDRTTPPGRLSRELREAGIPFLENKDDPEGFMWKGKLRQYLVVSDFDEWEEPITQAEFDRHMNSLPTYGALRARRPA